MSCQHLIIPNDKSRNPWIAWLSLGYYVHYKKKRVFFHVILFCGSSHRGILNTQDIRIWLYRLTWSRDCTITFLCVKKVSENLQLSCFVAYTMCRISFAHIYVCTCIFRAFLMYYKRAHREKLISPIYLPSLSSLSSVFICHLDATRFQILWATEDYLLHSHPYTSMYSFRPKRSYFYSHGFKYCWTKIEQCYRHLV